MTIYKHIAESTEDKTIFIGKVEIETNSYEEWDNLMKVLSTLGDANECDTVCPILP